MNCIKANWRKDFIKIGITTVVMLSGVKPVDALLYNRFEFTDRFGTKDTGGVITGKIGFDSLDSNHSGTDTVSASSFVIDSVPSYFESIWTDDLAFALRENIVGAGNEANPDFTRTYNFFTNSYIPSNTFTVTDGLITDFKFEERFYLNTPDPTNSDSTLNEQYEWVVLGGAANENSVEDLDTYPDGFPGNWLEITYPDRYVYDIDSIAFTSVPESSFTWGLLAIGGICGFSLLRKK